MSLASAYSSGVTAGYKNNSLLVATALRTTSRVIDEFNHMAFLYDPQWRYDPDIPSMPLSFMQVTSSSEVASSTIATKRIISYRGTTGNETQNVAQLQVVADNIISEPKEYKIEAIVPYTYAHLFTPVAHVTDGLTEGLAIGVAALQDAADNANLDRTEEAIEYISTRLSLAASLTMNAGLVSTICNTIMSLITAMDATVTMKTKVLVALKALTASVLADGNFFDSLQPQYNKNSMDLMAQSRHVLTMKYWADWRYRYVAVKSMTMDKHPEDGDNYRVQLDVQELPVLAMLPYGGIARAVSAAEQSASLAAKAVVSGLSIAGSTI